MKKKILLILTIVLLTCACSSSKSINVKNLKDKINKKETFVLYLTDDEDGKVLKNTLEKVSKENNLKTFYLNTEKLNDKDEKSLKEIITFDETNIVVFIKKGKEESVLTRINDLYISKAKLEEELKTQGYIKK